MLKWEVLADKVEARFAELGTQSPQVLKAIDAFARVLLTRIKMGFRTSRDPWGRTWAPLNKNLTRVGQPLRNTGRLLGSITARRQGDAVVVGTNLRVAKGDAALGAVHQFGADIKPVHGKYLVWAGPAKGLIFAKEVHIPARPFMPLDANGALSLPEPWANSALQAMARALELTP